MTHPIDKNILESCIRPPIIEILPGRLYAVNFDLMKLVPAKYILERAHEDGLIGPGSVIRESTSGTFGLALAQICKLSGYQFVMVSDPCIGPPLRQRLEDLGTRLEIVQKPAPTGGFQGPRLERLAEIGEEFPNSYWPQQYDNPRNPESYALLAEQILESVGTIDCLVAAVGSGGSVCGTARYLRLIHPSLRVVVVDTPNSVLFGQPDGKRLLRGLGNSLMPANLDHTAVNEVHWVSAAEGFRATRVLHQDHILYRGPTSGAAYLVAKRWADNHPGAIVVMILADQGYRYENDVYCDEWLHNNGLWLDKLPVEPKLVSHPHQAGPGWSYMNWGRRTYEQVMGHPFQAGGAK